MKIGSQPKEPDLNFRRPMFLGLLAVIFLAGGSFVWSISAKISGAVIASGAVVVEGKPKSIQHFDGGIIATIQVSSGDFVEQDQTLMELDDTSIRANLAIYEGRLREALVKQTRLQAELEDKYSFKAPEQRIRKLRLGDPEVSIHQQKTMMNARRSTLEAQQAGQDERIAQFNNQIVGVEGLIKEKRIQITGYDEEIEAASALVENNLSQKVG